MTVPVDLATVGRWMDAQGLPGGEFEQIEMLGGGTQNVMLRFVRGGRAFVLRRPPLHLRAKSNDVIRREMRLLTALEGTAVKSPTVIAACPDEDVLGGAVFYLMEPIDGFNAATTRPGRYADDVDWRFRASLSAVSEMAVLGEVDHLAVGLDDFGKPEGFLERQVSRWLSELDSYTELDGYPGPRIPHLDVVTDWLGRHRPRDQKPGILHGDYHLANLMFRYDRPELAAIVDWEMSTIGDPLLDLGWLLATWPDGSEQESIGGALVAAGGLPTAEELIAHYGERSSRDLSAIDWYVVLACFKLAIILEGTHARACAGKADTATGDRLHAMAVALFERAARIAA